MGWRSSKPVRLLSGTISGASESCGEDKGEFSVLGAWEAGAPTSGTAPCLSQSAMFNRSNMERGTIGLAAAIPRRAMDKVENFMMCLLYWFLEERFCRKGGFSPKNLYDDSVDLRGRDDGADLRGRSVLYSFLGTIGKRS